MLFIHPTETTERKDIWEKEARMALRAIALSISKRIVGIHCKTYGVQSNLSPGRQSFYYQGQILN